MCELMCSPQNYCNMKKLVIMSAFLGLLSVAASAQSQTPRADVREKNQHLRIHDGKCDGSLTRRETVLLKKEQRNIRRTERRAKADGHVSAREKAKLEMKQDRASRHIRRAKHN